MSFLSELKKQKQRLKETETVVTQVDGQRFIYRQSGDSHCLPNSHGFVVDTKPDDIPALIVDHLYIGSQDCTTTSILEKYNIKHVVSLGINIEVSVNNIFVECLDLPETDVRPVLNEALPFIFNAVGLKKNVLIHCNAGVSRTSMVAIGYLMHYACMSFDEAYGLVKERRPAIQPNTGFKKQLMAMRPGKIF